MTPRSKAAPTSQTADIDAIVRKADGTIMLVGGNPYILSHVAATTDITTDTWQTQTITFAFPAYTVVDQTHYLEIALSEDVKPYLGAYAPLRPTLKPARGHTHWHLAIDVHGDQLLSLFCRVGRTARRPFLWPGV